MTGMQQVVDALPEPWKSALSALPPEVRRRVQDVRIRLEAPAGVSLPGEYRPLRQPDGTALCCTRAQMDRLISRLCEDSVYSRQEELAQGFLSAPGGLRVGVAGTAVCRGERVACVREITSVCIRIPGHHDGCAAPLLPYLTARPGGCGLLLCSAPCGGKTTLLRDAARLLAAAGRRGSVVDSRGELAWDGCLQACDVLRGYPAATGLLQAVRCLAPEFVVLDELGGAEQGAAVWQSSYAGVALLASVHAADAADLRARPWLWQAICGGCFDYIAFLRGRTCPGQIRRIGGYKEWLHEDGGIDTFAGSRDGGRDAGCRPLASAGDAVEANGATARTHCGADPHRRSTPAASAGWFVPGKRPAAVSAGTVSGDAWRPLSGGGF